MPERIIVIECPDCKGTGLFKGNLERGGSAVVCYKCGGTGATEFQYNDFEGRKRRNDVTRVFPRSLGYIHYDDDIVSEETGKTIHYSQYGCTYEEWLKGEIPKPMEELYCPYQFVNKGVRSEPCSRCTKGTRRVDIINHCTFFYDKSSCWQEYHHKRERY